MQLWVLCLGMLFAPGSQTARLLWVLIDQGGLEGVCVIRASGNFGDRVQHKGEGTGYREEGTEGARRGDRVQHRGEGIGYNTGEKG